MKASSTSYRHVSGAAATQPTPMTSAAFTFNRQMQINLDRAAQAQPNISTPKGYGNGVQYDSARR